MRTSLILTTLLSLAFALPAQAQVYKWKDAQGRTVISDAPQPGAGKQAPALQTPAPGTGNGDKSWAEKDLEFKKRQQEKRDATEKSGKETAAAEQKKQNCERAKQQQAVLESGERLAVRNAQGEREFLDDSQRQQEIERGRKTVQEWCK